MKLESDLQLFSTLIVGHGESVTRLLVNSKISSLYRSTFLIINLSSVPTFSVEVKNWSTCYNLFIEFGKFRNQRIKHFLSNVDEVPPTSLLIHHTHSTDHEIRQSYTTGV